MNLDSFSGEGSTPSRRRFWDKVTQAVNASQKLEGRNVGVDEHQGMGTLINVVRERGGAADTGACCDEVGGCTITTEGDCAGIFQGVGTPCDPNPCCSSCCDVPPCGLTWQGCFDGDTCWTGPELCEGGCGGEEIPCELAINGLWFTDTQYCIMCPGNELELHVISHTDPVTCEFTQVFYSDCDIGDTHVMSDYFPPCPE